MIALTGVDVFGDGRPFDYCCAGCGDTMTISAEDQAASRCATHGLTYGIWLPSDTPPTRRRGLAHMTAWNAGNVRDSDGRMLMKRGG